MSCCGVEETIVGLLAGGALGPHLRVKLSGGVLVVASGSEDELGTLANRTLAANEPVTVYPRGEAGVRYMVASGAISQYAQVYAAANGKVAGSGTLTRGTAMEAATADGDIIRVACDQASLSGAVPRTQLTQDDLQPYVIPLSRFQAPGTGAQLGSSAGTPSGALGLTIGTHGTATPKLVGEAASGNSKSNSGRVQFALPAEYVSGETITLRVRCKITGNVQVAQTIDALVYKSDDAAGVGSDLCATAAQSVTSSAANYDFTITPTGLAAGDTLDVLITAAANDTGGTANKLIEIYRVAMLLDIKG